MSEVAKFHGFTTSTPGAISRRIVFPPRYQNRTFLSATCFYLREVKDDNKVILEDKDLEVIGVPNVRYDDVTVIAQHMETGYWLSYKAYQVK